MTIDAPIMVRARRIRFEIHGKNVRVEHPTYGWITIAKCRDGDHAHAFMKDNYNGVIWDYPPQKGHGSHGTFEEFGD